MTNRLTEILTEIKTLKERDYTRLERWERAKLASLQAEAKKLYNAPSERAKADRALNNMLAEFGTAMIAEGIATKEEVNSFMGEFFNIQLR